MKDRNFSVYGYPFRSETYLEIIYHIYVHLSSVKLPLKISLWYFVIGVTYITVSDLLLTWSYDEQMEDKLFWIGGSILKGWLFITITALLLYVILKKYIGRLVQQRRLLDAVVNNTRDMLWMIDADKKLLLANTSVVKSLGERNQMDIVGRNALDLAIDESEREFWKDKYSKALEGEEFRFLHTTNSKKGSTVYLECHLYPITDNDGIVQRVGCFAHDITEIKTAQKEVELQYEKMKEITWIQSHEFRKPVANIQGLVEALDPENPLSEDNKEILSHITAQTEELDKMMRQVIDRVGAVDSERSANPK